MVRLFQYWLKLASMEIVFPLENKAGGIFALSSSGHKAQFNLQFFKPIPCDNEAIPCVPATCCDHRAFQQHGLTFPKVGLEVLSVSSLAQQSLPPAVLHGGQHLLWDMACSPPLMPAHGWWHQVPDRLDLLPFSEVEHRAD